MSNFLARLRAHSRRWKTGVFFGVLLLGVLGEVVGYYVISWYSVNQVSAQILSASRTVRSSTDFDYTIIFRILAPGAMTPIRANVPTISWSLDSIAMGGLAWLGEIPYDNSYHLNPGQDVTLQGKWHSSWPTTLSSDQIALSQSKANNIHLSLYFYDVNGGWYDSGTDFGITRETSTTWTWTS